MAIGIRNYPQVTPPDSDYPDGRIKDDTGINDGTPINVKTNGDIQQFFAKLMRLAGITPNGLPDSEYNGLQLIQALFNDTGWIAVTSYETGATGQAFYRRVRNRVFIKGYVATTSTLGSWAYSWFILPAGFRPTGGSHFLISNLQDNNSGGHKFPIWTIINDSGSIGGADVSDLTATATIYLDNISFFID